jgi:hypothetical protein
MNPMRGGEIAMAVLYAAPWLAFMTAVLVLSATGFG